MGRPRISVTNAPDALDLLEPGVSEATQKALDTPRDKRTEEQRSLLLARYKLLDAGWKKIDARIKEHVAQAPRPSIVKALISSEGVTPVRLHTQGEDVLKETHFLRRGDPNQKEAIATPGYLQVLTTGPARWKKQPPRESKLSYRRAAFAEWITDVNGGGGHLLARVIVNRLWQHHLGRGIVATPSDFGVRGERPTHPELLNYLATELIKNGWKLKPIHKLIMTSAVYQTASTLDEAKSKIDRDNSLFWHRPARRLDAEAIRDSLLFISGQLDETEYGPGTLDEASRRRSIYFTMKRSKLIPMLVIFDAPDGTVGVGERPSTTVAPQALLMMNNPQVRSWAKAFGRRAGEETSNVREAIHGAYLIALSRKATPDELSDGVEFVKRQQESYAGRPDARELALADLCQVVMCLNEFMYVD